MPYLSFLAVLALLAGQQTSTYTWDVNGERVLQPGIQTQIEERLLRSDASGRLIERLVRSFDSTGAELPAERIVIEEAAGRTTTSLYRAGINGGFQLTEESVATSTGNRMQERTETEVRRPDINGSLDLAERRVTVTRRTDDTADSEVTVYMPLAGNGLREAWREVSHVETSGGRTTEQSSRYQAAPDGGQQLVAGVETATQRDPGGSETSVVTLYGLAAPGRPAVSGKLQVREQRKIERRSTAPDTVVESLSVRRPSLSDQRLGPYTRISETICTGCTKISLPAALPATAEPLSPSPKTAR